ncbi:MAG: transposase [Elusimicrobiota bacterium]|nr:transposase [Elusimicrobiota bacterium]
MSRPIRIEYPGAVYHVISRGDAKEKIFRDADDYKKFLDVIKKAKHRYGTIVYAYALMPNHYHLLIETTRANLARLMHCVQTTYSVYYNNSHGRTGHVFQGRYKAILVEKDNYLLRLSRYIHLNPVRAKMVKRPQDYIWSSFGEYSGLADSHVSEPEFVMESFGSSSAESIRKYAEFCGIDDSEEIKKLIYGQFVIGSREFTDKVKKICAAGGKNLSGEISGGRKIKTRNSKDKIINETARAYGVTAEKVLKKQGLPRQTAMYLIRKHTDMKLKDIAEMFGGMHYTAVNKTVMRFEKKAQLAEIRIKLGIIEAVFVK